MQSRKNCGVKTLKKILDSFPDSYEKNGSGSFTKSARHTCKVVEISLYELQIVIFTCFNFLKETVHVILYQYS